MYIYRLLPYPIGNAGKCHVWCHKTTSKKKWERKPAAKNKNSCRTANFKASITKFLCGAFILFYFSLHPSFLNVFLWRRTYPLVYKQSKLLMKRLFEGTFRKRIKNILKSQYVNVMYSFVCSFFLNIHICTFSTTINNKRNVQSLKQFAKELLIILIFLCLSLMVSYTQKWFTYKNAKITPNVKFFYFPRFYT